MFKPKKQKSEPVVNAATQTEVERVIARGARIKKLSDEASMWRNFAAGCKPGRFLTEHSAYAAFGLDERAAPLSLRMDDDTALLWAAFAQQMADERERRLKDVLGM